MVKHYKIINTLFFLIILLFAGLKPLYAANTIPSIKDIIKGERATTAARAGYSTDEKTINIAETGGKYLQTSLSFLGVIFLVLIIYAGFIWMNAQGNADEAGKAKTIMINASIGLVIILASYAISNYIIGRLVEAAVAK